jgi:pyridoxamine 5'-phosphate oxidase
MTTTSTTITTAALTATAATSLSSWRHLLEISIVKTRKIRGSNYVQLATVDRMMMTTSLPEPRVRTVVFRGFLESNLPLNHKNILDHPPPNVDVHDNNSNKGNPLLLPYVMKMCTDARSRKVQETQQQQQQQSIAELVWWFPKTSEQYRIRGQLLMIGEQEHQNDDDDESKQDRRILTIARKQLWGNLSDSARESFYNPKIPGQPWSMECTYTTTTNHNVDWINNNQGGRDADGKVLPPPSNFLLLLLNPTMVDYLCLTGSQYRQIDIRMENDNWFSQRVNP